MAKLFVCLICFCIPLLAQAKLYKIVDANGKVTYTDIAPALESKEHQLGRINAVSNPLFNMAKLNLTIPYTGDNGTMIVSGSVNGINMRFIVDTGATLLAIPPSIATQAGLHDLPSQTVTAQTANGAVEVPKVTIKNLSVAKVRASQIEATIQSISTTEPNLGLLGMSFFSAYKMTIDHVKKEIQLEKK